MNHIKSYGNIVFKILNEVSDFYYFFINLVNVEFTNNPKVPTAGLRLDTINFTIEINKDFWEIIESENSYKKRMFLLIHELYHLLYKHYLLIKDYDDKLLFNIAADAYINRTIIYSLFGNDKNSYFIQGGVWWEELEIPVGIVDSGTDAVYKYLSNPKNQNETFKKLYNSCKGGIQIFIKGHDGWKELENSSISPEVLAEAISSNIDSLILEANSMSKQAGLISKGVKNIIDKLLTKKVSVINWKKELESFIQLFSSKIYLKKSYFKRSKFFDDAFALKIKFKPKIAVIVDTSGSMSGDLIIQAFQELEHISKKADLDIIVIECDADITKDSVYEYKNLSTLVDRLKKTGYIGGGGTLVDPALDYINNEVSDIASVVYLTDGYVPKPLIKIKYPLFVGLVGSVEPQAFKKQWENINCKIIKINKSE